MLHAHHLCGASLDALSAFDAVGVEITLLVSSRIAGRELHRTHLGAETAFHTAGRRNSNCRESLLGSAGSRPCRERTHGAECTPCTRCIYESENYANNGCQKDNIPECASYPCHCKPVHIHLHPEHAKYKEEHEDAEHLAAHKRRYGPVRRVTAYKPVVKAAARTEMTAPVSALAHRHGYGAYHAYNGNNSYFGNEVGHNKINE